MYKGKKILTIIPARGGSKGLPDKNVKNLCGLPLVAWPIKAALGSGYIDKCIVSTDCPNIAEVAIRHHAEVPFLRPANLAADESPTSDLIIHALDYFSRIKEHYDYILLLEPTSPLTESTDIDRAIKKIVEQKGQSLVSVAKLDSMHPSYCSTITDSDKLKPYNMKKFGSPVRRQEMDDIYFFDGSLYLSDLKTYREKETFYHEKTLPLIMPSWKSMDIDTLLDFILIEAIIKNRKKLMAIEDKVSGK